ncbi:hypothetical protein [Streptomyces sp. NPDC051576]|uniref:hypothetical protein n=1 Tax=Streptomyces sp. NPDC051576 TaxID=3155803 RepID=UPI003414AF97
MTELDTNAPDLDVLNALRASLADVALDTPVERIVATGRARRRTRRLGLTAGAGVAAAALALGVSTYGNPSTAPPSDEIATGAGTIHIRTAAYTVDSLKNGSVRVSWDKQAYFDDHAGLAKALHDAGFPVLIKVGEFCKGTDDPGTLDRSGTGPGVNDVRTAHREGDDKVVFDFDPAAMPAGKQMFIGYLTADQQKAGSGGRVVGSVERIVPTDTSQLTCSGDVPTFG